MSERRGEARPASSNFDSTSNFEKTAQMGKGGGDLKGDKPGSGIRATSLRDRAVVIANKRFTSVQNERLADYRDAINKAAEGDTAGSNEAIGRAHESLQAEPNSTFLSPDAIARAEDEVGGMSAWDETVAQLAKKDED